MLRIYSFFTIFIYCFLLKVPAQQIIAPNSDFDSYFAIITDQITFDSVKTAIISYQKSIEDDGLGTFIIIDNWKTPDDVKKQIKKIFKSHKPLEGVVFVGDIPIPMLRDAQHLTSAFKIDQDNKRFTWKRTSVPSDRFYDDFDLEFTYLKQDTSNKLLHYYNLNPDSPQKIESDIYSARIKPPVSDNKKYQLLRNYLVRIVKQKQTESFLSNAMIFTGHGYHSESLDAWSNSTLSYREQFPTLFSSQGNIKFYNHVMRTDLKSVILRELQNPLLDMSIFHAHGAASKQYLLGFEPAESILQNIESIKLFLRSKLANAKRKNQSLEEKRQDYMQRYGIPLEWFDDIENDSLKLADSLLYASQDIHIEDINKIRPMAKFIYFDECYNGAFINTPYIAGAYLFNDGEVISTAGYSVNVRQDTWADEHLGLLDFGCRIGQWLKLKNSLELHIIGDPTFHFKNRNSPNINKILGKSDISEKTLKIWLNSAYAPLQTLAVSKLFKIHLHDFEKDLIRIYNNSYFFNVRLMALKCMAELRTNNFEEIVVQSLSDPNEMIRRVSANWMGDIGKTTYLKYLAQTAIWDPSDRVRFNAKSALVKIDAVEAARLCQEELDSAPDETTRNRFQYVVFSLSRSEEWLQEDLLKRLFDQNEKLKKRISAIRTFRNYRFHKIIPQLTQIAENKSEIPIIRQTVIEALGWFTLSHEKEKIISTCDAILLQSDLPTEIRNETIKTKNILLQGPNDPITP